MLKKDFQSLHLRFQVELLLHIFTACHNGFNLVIGVARGLQLTGKEDPLLLHPVISCWTSTSAYQEGRIIGVCFICKGFFTSETC